MKKTAMTTFIIGIFIFVFVLPMAVFTGNVVLFNLAGAIGAVSSIVFWIAIVKIVLDALTK
nr:MAG TPA: hypothetical protein [Caudoviricetes sp.]